MARGSPTAIGAVRVIWSATALSDLEDISKWIEADRGIETANRITTLVVDAVETLSAMPNRGRLARKSPYRELVIARTPYIAIYRTSTDSVYVLRIVHAAQQVF